MNGLFCVASLSEFIVNSSPNFDALTFSLNRLSPPSMRTDLPGGLRGGLGVGLGGPALVTGLDGSARGSPVSTLSIPAAVGGSAGGARGGGEGTSVGAADLPVVGETALDGTSANLIGTRDLGLLLVGGVLVLLGLGVAVEVQVGHDVPLGLTAGESATEAEDLTGEHPPDETDGVTTLVVGGDGNIDVLGGRVGVAERDDGDVDVGSLLDGLGVGAGVGGDDQAGLLERAGDVVGEVTGGEATGDGGGTSVGGELQDGTLTVGTGRDNANVGGVVNGDDDAGSEDDLLPVIAFALEKPKLGISRSPKKRSCSNAPGLANVDDVDTVGAGLPEVRLHVHLEVLGTNVALKPCQSWMGWRWCGWANLSGEEHLDVLAGGSHSGGGVGGRHLDRYRFATVVTRGEGRRDTVQKLSS